MELTPKEDAKCVAELRGDEPDTLARALEWWAGSTQFTEEPDDAQKQLLILASYMEDDNRTRPRPFFIRNEYMTEDVASALATVPEGYKFYTQKLAVKLKLARESACLPKEPTEARRTYNLGQLAGQMALDLRAQLTVMHETPIPDYFQDCDDFWRA